jgi:hypothetical protein
MVWFFERFIRTQEQSSPCPKCEQYVCTYCGECHNPNCKKYVKICDDFLIVQNNSEN